MSKTTILALPHIAPAQAQKHVTHNEALDILDALVQLVVTAFISDSNVEDDSDNYQNGHVYIIGEEAQGSWSNKAGRLVVYENGGWREISPRPGWLAYVLTEKAHFIYESGMWQAAFMPANALTDIESLTVNMAPDSGYKFGVTSPYILFNHEGDDVRVALNKNSDAATASIIYQTGFSARAEIGLTGTDDLNFKISPDGHTWLTPLTLSTAGDTIIINADVFTDRWLKHESNTGLGVSVFGSENLVNASGLEGLRNSAVGYRALRDLTSGRNNTAMGYCAGLQTTTGRNNAAFGASALYSNTSGNDNVALGYAALFPNLTGTGNVSVGVSTLYSNISGSYNTAIGSNALRLNSIGDRNVAVGSGALYSNTNSNGNAAIGVNALRLNQLGNSNTAIGLGALYALVSGNNNIANGSNAARFLTTGSSNTALGHDALSYGVDGSQLTDISNSTAIGNGARVSGSNQVQLGNSQTSCYAYGSIQQRSDARDKAEISDTALGLDFIMQLRPVDYKYDMRDDYDDGKRDGRFLRRRFHHGFIAQDVAKTSASFQVEFGGVQHHNHAGNGQDVLSLGYSEFIAPLVAAVQEQQAMIEELQAKIK